MARTKKAARKASLALAQADSESEEDTAKDAGCEECTEDDGLDEWSVKDILVATLLREQRKLMQAIRYGNAGKHEIRRTDNRGNCGIGDCKAKGSAMACVTCKVRLCRHTECLNAHINERKGRVVSDKVELIVSEDQGEQKEIRGRAQRTSEATRRRGGSGSGSCGQDCQSAKVTLL